MPLIDCPACGNRISIEAEACPQCGHPNRPATRAPEGPKCYACSAIATTKCQSCGALSCAQHLESIYVYHGESGANELRCQSCYESARAWKVFRWIIVGVALLIILIIFLQMGRR
jgi:hypothetical protein